VANDAEIVSEAKHSAPTCVLDGQPMRTCGSTPGAVSNIQLPSGTTWNTSPTSGDCHAVTPPLAIGGAAPDHALTSGGGGTGSMRLAREPSENESVGGSEQAIMASLRCMRVCERSP
jgi:hypothetical protein